MAEQRNAPDAVQGAEGEDQNPAKEPVDTMIAEHPEMLEPCRIFDWCSGHWTTLAHTLAHTGVIGTAVTPFGEDSIDVYRTAWDGHTTMNFSFEIGEWEIQSEGTIDREFADLRGAIDQIESIVRTHVAGLSR